MKSPFVLSILVVAACSSDPPAQTVGVNDVRRACEIRASWGRLTSVSCADCRAIAASPKCDCPAFQQEYAGKCSTHRDAKLAEPACEGVDACANSCPATDCNCVEGCYASHDACRPRGAALDGCIAEVCETSCR